jgi:hypothetical protein
MKLEGFQFELLQKTLSLFLPEIGDCIYFGIVENLGI